MFLRELGFREFVFATCLRVGIRLRKFVFAIRLRGEFGFGRELGSGEFVCANRLRVGIRLRELVFAIRLRGGIRLRDGIRLREFVFAFRLRVGTRFRELVFAICFRLRVEKYYRPSGCNALTNQKYNVQNTNTNESLRVICPIFVRIVLCRLQNCVLKIASYNEIDGYPGQLMSVLAALLGLLLRANIFD